MENNITITAKEVTFINIQIIVGESKVVDAKPKEKRKLFEKLKSIFKNLNSIILWLIKVIPFSMTYLLIS